MTPFDVDAIAESLRQQAQTVLDGDYYCIGTQCFHGIMANHDLQAVA